MESIKGAVYLKLNLLLSFLEFPLKAVQTTTVRLSLNRICDTTSRGLLAKSGHAID
jgi:hypothetical protein